MKSIFQLISINFKEFFREPAILFWAIIFPIIMAWVLGIAFSSKTELIRTVGILETGNADSVSLYQKLSNKGFSDFSESDGRKKFQLVHEDGAGNKTVFRFVAVSESEAQTDLKRGKITVFIEAGKDSGTITYHFDPKNSEAQLTYLTLEKILNVGNGKGSEENKLIAITQKGSRYIDFLVPGLIAFGIMNSAIWGIGWVLIEFRMKKLLRRMLATPMKRSHFLIAQITTRIILSFVESLLLFVFAHFYFGIEIQGSIMSLFLLFLTGNFAFTGIAILLSSRASNTRVGNGLINAVTMPMMILSGVFFSYHTFPDWAIPVIQSLPLTTLADGLRAVFIEGAGLSETIKPIIILSSVGIVTFTFGLKVYKWH